MQRSRAFWHIFRLQSRLINSTTSIRNSEIQTDTYNISKICRLYCTPALNDSAITNIDSVIGIHVGYSAVLWAKVEVKSNYISELNSLQFPKDMNKMELHQLYSVAFDTVRSLPTGSCYVMEQFSKIVSGTGGKVQLTLHATRMQYMAMLTALINFNMSSIEEKQGVQFLKPRLPARLFNLLVGKEVVSSEEVVSRILSGNCGLHYSPMSSSCEVLSFYEKALKPEKELLGQTLLLTLTFTELMLYKNQNCYKMLLDAKKKS